MKKEEEIANKFSNETRVQILEKNNFNHGKLFRLKKNWSLHLQLSSDLLHKNVRVFCNLPPKEQDTFNRGTYYEYEWKWLKNSLKHDDFNKFISIECNKSGAFNYYFTLNNQTSPEGGSHFLIDPDLYFANGLKIDMDSLQMQTYLTKLLGPLDEWKSRLEVAKHSSYNMIHFTPIQELSKESNSSYCISNHLKLIDQSSKNGKYNLNDLEVLIDSIYKDWNMLSICDLVYNHMANDSDFLQKCPNATYNMSNSKFLIPAFIVDRILYHINLDISKGKYETQGISQNKFEEHNIETLRHIIRNQEFPKYKVEEFFIIDINKTLTKIKQIGLLELENIENNLDEYKKLDRKNSFTYEEKENEWKKLNIIQDLNYKRLMSSIDFDLVDRILKLELKNLNLNLDIKNSNENSQILINIYSRFAHELNKKNEAIKNIINEYLNEAANNVISNVYYHFFAHDGPKWNKVDEKHPICRTYFYFPFKNENVELDESFAFDKENSLKIQAHNGWVMNDDPLKNFASENSTVYFRRQLIPWGDSVKLNYGNEPRDNPELWNYFTEYTKISARIFHGVRLDNCHSTPLHVAQYFLDVARSVRPNLYVIAELFTNSEDVDNKFVSELGINSLIREAIGAWNANELGRLIHRFCPETVGSFRQHSYRYLKQSLAHAIFYDITHDNESLIKKHSVYDVLPTSSLVLMSSCAVGSTRGFDEMVPHHINVVTEERLYSIWDADRKAFNSINLDSGIVKAKSILNKLHYEMGINNFNQLYVDQFDADTTVVTRHNPDSHESIILIARTSFSSPNHYTSNNLYKPLFIPSRIESILLEASTIHQSNSNEFKPSELFLNGFENYKLDLSENVSLSQSKFIERIEYNGEVSHVHFKYFPPGAIALFKVVLNEGSLYSLSHIRNSLFELINSKVNAVQSNCEIEKILANLTYDELNILLFRCSSEEQSENINSDVYNIPNHGPLVYCGLQGFVNILEKQRLENNLGHSLFENLRNGDWSMQYICERLKKYHELRPTRRAQLNLLSLWLTKLFQSISKLPRYLIPAYFDLVITNLYSKSLERCWTLMNLESLKINFKISNGSSFVRALALGSVSLSGHLETSLLPRTICNFELDDLMLSLSAGLPFFSTTYMRNWGRDTFISLRGLLLLTNRFKDARDLILAYGSCLRHGLIPNLLGEGKGARYNCRDSVWWWLKAIRDYTELVPNGMDILNSTLYRLYPTDDSPHPTDEELVNKSNEAKKQKLFDIIQEALTVHVKGLKFRERNAGPSIDNHMMSEGFNNEIGVDLETGFVFGGNSFNCGTWMDKLGSSSKAGNYGFPATPRDGSAVELIGLSRCVLDWLINSNMQQKYPYDGVILDNTSKIKLTWTEWASKIDANFEKYFWIDESSKDSKHINKRNIYKDTLNSSIPWTEYQLRPNFLIAITVAPQMVDKEHAKKAIEQCTTYLMNDENTIGIKTLDESDYNYCGFYDNSNDSNDTKVAHGFNYHQGPEWLWPVGYYLRAKLDYFNDNNDQKTNAIVYVKKHLAKLNKRMHENDWKSLPELTNKNGEECYFSCASQAWSVATILEVFYALSHYE